MFVVFKIEREMYMFVDYLLESVIKIFIFIEYVYFLHRLCTGLTKSMGK